MFRKKVEQLLQEALEKDPALFLITLDIGENNQIRVIIDGDKGINLKDCMAVSRAIEHNLDREEQDFSLEVTSPGLSEPLVNKRQFKKNIGRNFSVKQKDGTCIEGQLIEVREADILLQWKTREKKPIGKGKITVQKEAVLDFDNIVEAKVLVKF